MWTQLNFIGGIESMGKLGIFPEPAMTLSERGTGVYRQHWPLAARRRRNIFQAARARQSSANV